MTCIKAVIFDLDNTLYDETDYIYAAYRGVARFLSNRCRFSEEELYTKLVSDLKKKGSLYPRLFNDLVADLGLDQSLVPDILSLYAGVDVPISLFAESEATLLTLRQLGMKLALVTNGGTKTQRNKVRLLDVEKYFEVIVYSRETEGALEKPHPEVYEETLKKLGTRAENVLCVGDNPYTDFLGAKKLRMRTLRLLRGEFRDVHLSDEYEAEYVLNSLEGLFEVLKYINNQ